MLGRKTVLAALVALVALSCGAYSGYRVWRHFQPFVPQAAPKTAIVISAPTAPPEAPATPTAPPTPTPLPPSVFIKVPYTSQFPYAGQSASGNPHLEYCEAAALLMMAEFYKGDPRDRIPPAEADPAMGQIVQTERRVYPRVDLPLTVIGSIGTQLFGLRPTVMPAELDPIERQLAAGHPVIIPVMTHGGVNNTKISPHYAEGDSYHVLVITGYDNDKRVLYTNDAGFIQGQNWAYTWDTLSSAMDAANRKYGQGRVMLVFDKA